MMFQHVDDPDDHTPPTEPLPDFLVAFFPLEMDMFAAMSEAPHHASHEPTRHGAGPSFYSAPDGEVTSLFDQAAINAI